MVDDQLGGALCADTDKRRQFGRDNPLRARAEYAEAVLIDAGWLVAPNQGAEDLLASTQVAEVLGVRVQTARRELRGGRIPCAEVADPSGGTWLVARRRDAARRTWERDRADGLTDLASELGVEYHSLWRIAKRLSGQPSVDDTRRLNLTADQLEQVRAEHQPSWSCAAGR